MYSRALTEHEAMARVGVRARVSVRARHIVVLRLVSGLGILLC